MSDFDQEKQHGAFAETPRYRFEDYATGPDFNRESELETTRSRMTSNRNGEDDNHLRLLSKGHVAFAIVNALFSSIPIFHLVIGLLILTGSMGGGAGAFPALFGAFFVAIALLIIGSGYALSVCNFLASKYIKERRKHTFCFVVDCINCAVMPFGTVLGVLGIVVMSRESVKAKFAAGDPK